MAAAVAAGVPNAVVAERSMAGGLRLGSGPRPRAVDLPVERQSVVAAVRQSRFHQDIQILTHPLGEGQQEDLEIAVCRFFCWGFPLLIRQCGAEVSDHLGCNAYGLMRDVPSPSKPAKLNCCSSCCDCQSKAYFVILVVLC